MKIEFILKGRTYKMEFEVTDNGISIIDVIGPYNNNVWTNSGIKSIPSISDAAYAAARAQIKLLEI